MLLKLSDGTSRFREFVIYARQTREWRRHAAPHRHSRSCGRTTPMHVEKLADRQAIDRSEKAKIRLNLARHLKVTAPGIEEAFRRHPAHQRGVGGTQIFPLPIDSGHFPRGLICLIAHGLRSFAQTVRESRFTISSSFSFLFEAIGPAFMMLPHPRCPA